MAIGDVQVENDLEQGYVREVMLWSDVPMNRRLTEEHLDAELRELTSEIEKDRQRLRRTSYCAAATYAGERGSWQWGGRRAVYTPCSGSPSHEGFCKRHSNRRAVAFKMWQVDPEIHIARAYKPLSAPEARALQLRVEELERLLVRLIELLSPRLRQTLVAAVGRARTR